MPRQGVPYPSREICSLKCQIDALQRQINELMKSINGVQGDGQGNVSLVSGDPAVVINNDASQNQIEIALDQSELPAAAVRMVNGMTGAVVLAANDIYAGANTVGFEIADLKAENLLRKQGITNEISNRQAADAALQANINALQASIPGEAAQAVANDPTVQGLVTADAQNVKLSGAQTVGGVKTFTATPIVPTPAAGSTDGSVPNTNWISQTGDSGPNNLVHRTGNETVAGNKTFTRSITGYASGKFLGACGPNGPNVGNVYLMAKIDNLPNNEGAVFRIVGGLNNANYVYGMYRAYKISSGVIIQCINKSYSSAYQKPKLYIYNNNGTIEIYGTSMSWCVPQLFFDYWENGGLIYTDLNRHTMTASTDFSTVTLPTGAVAETGLLTEM